MLRSSVRAATPEIQELVDQFIHEETRALMRERRDSSRFPITRIARISRLNNSEVIQAITRDISALGVGLIAKHEWKRGEVVRIEIDRLERTPSAITAECRWCQVINDGWFLSGWHFRNVEAS